MPRGVYKRTKETKKKMSLSRLKRKKELGYINSPESRKKMSETRKGEGNPFYNKHHSKKSRKKMSEAKKGRKASEETKRKISEGLKGNKNSFGYKMSREHIRKILRRRPMSGLEIRVNDVIKKHSLPYKFVGNGKFFIERKNPDFVNTNGEKIVVEVYCRKQKENVRGLDVETWKENRSKLFAKYGWQIVFIEDWQTNKEETILGLLKGVNL